MGPPSFFKVTRTTIKAWMRLNFTKNQSQAAVLTALERKKNDKDIHGRSVVTIFECLFLILAGNRGTHKRLNESDNPPHPTINYRVSCT